MLHGLVVARIDRIDREHTLREQRCLCPTSLHGTALPRANRYASHAAQRHLIAATNVPTVHLQTVMRLRRDKENMDFVVATIPTTMALEESARLVAALRREGVPASTIVANQVVGDAMGAPYLRMKLAEQRKALDMLRESPHLRGLPQIRGRYVDLEVAGIPALQYFAGKLWQGMPLPAAGAGEGLVRAGARRRCCMLRRQRAQSVAVLHACAGLRST